MNEKETELFAETLGHGFHLKMRKTIPVLSKDLGNGFFIESGWIISDHALTDLTLWVGEEGPGRMLVDIAHGIPVREIVSVSTKLEEYGNRLASEGYDTKEKVLQFMKKELAEIED